MKRYLIVAALGPSLGGLLLLFATTVSSGYWTDTSWSEVGKFFGAYARTLQYAYLFGLVPALMIGAVDDILSHVQRINWRARVPIMGAIGFAVAELLYGFRGDASALQFILYGLVGMVPAMLASWWAHKVETPAVLPGAKDAAA